MAGKKNKAEGKAQSRRGAGPLPSSGIDDITRRLTGMQVQDELTTQQDTLSLPAPAPGEAIQEQNLKAALDSPSIYVETTDNDGIPSVVEIEREVALLSPYVQREVLQQGNGVSHDRPIILPNKVTLEILELLLTYCRFHRASGRSDKERKIFDEKFIRLDTRRLCELTSAADALAMKPLVDLTSRALARLIEGKTPEQIRAQFQLPDDLTEEEKLEPVRNFGDDPKIRLLNRLYEKKRRELQKRREDEQKLISDGAAPTLTLEEKRQQDERSVDELLSFIENGGGGGGGGGSTAATPRGPRKKKGKQGRRLSPSEDAQHNSSTPMPSAQHSASMRGSQNAVPSPVPDRLDDTSSSVPVARKLASTIDAQDASIGTEQRDNVTRSKSESRDMKPFLASVREENSQNLVQNGLRHSQECLDAQAKAQQPMQQRVNGLTNRHLSEEDDAEDAKQQEDGNVSEASDGDEMDDEEDEEEEDEAAGNSYQMRSKELLSGSFGPLQGPFTTLTSLATFRARFQHPEESSTLTVAQDAERVQPSSSSLAGPAREAQSSAAGVQGSSEQRAAENSNPKLAAGAGPSVSPVPESGTSHLDKQTQAGHDRQQPLSASRVDRNGDAVGQSKSQHEMAELSSIWEVPANVDTAFHALEAFLQKCGLSEHIRVEHSAVKKACSRTREAHNSRRERFRATETPHSWNGSLDHAVEHRANLSTGHVVRLEITQEPE